MTYAEAEGNLRRNVTVLREGDLYNGKIYDYLDGAVVVNFGDGNLGPFGWFEPEQLTFGWTGRPYDGPVHDWDNEKWEFVQVS